MNITQLCDKVYALAHRNDPKTSQEAAGMMNATKTTKGHNWQVLDVLWHYDDKALTWPEIAAQLPHLDKAEVSRRISGLKQKGIIIVVGTKKIGNKNYSLFKIK